MSRETASHTRRAHTRRARTRSIRSTITSLLVIPLISLIALWAYAATSTVGGAIAQRNYDTENNDTGAPAQALVVDLVQERAQTFIWLSTDRRTSPAGLDAQRARTDAAIAAFRAGTAAAGAALSSVTWQNLTTLSGKLNQLGGIRTAAGAGVMTPIAAFEAYNAIVDAQFQFLQSEAAVPNGSISLYQQAEANLDAGQALELIGREAALAGGALASGGLMSQAEHDLFVQAVDNQRLLERVAESPSNWQQRPGPYPELFASPVYADFKAMEDRIVADTDVKAPIPVSATAWQSGVQSFLAAFERAVSAGRQDGIAGAAHAGNVILLRLILVGGAGLTAVIVSALLLLRFGRRVTRELTSFLIAVRALADERLPLVVSRLRRGEHVDVAAEAPPLDVRSHTQEVTKIAEAFSAVQRTAVEAAVGQAELRTGANNVFRSLARRNQSLLQRQLRMLDTMERGTNDPEALEQLFLLDHLTTRMRRHAEGLIILSGAPPGRSWRKPVPVIEMLRGAIGEIEDYVRVDMITDVRDFVAGTAVADVTHLLAELIENAVSYSPPHTRVQVKASRVASGFVVEIEDRGLGIPPETLAALNDRLANPPEFDLADADQLGLFVISRLAARHEIKVSLRGSPYGGTTAIVLLPHRIVVREGDSAALPGADLVPAAIGSPGWVRGSAADAPSDGRGLVRRLRQASLAPQLRDAPPADLASAGGAHAASSRGAHAARSADQARALIASIQHGWRNGRAEADQASEGGQETPTDTDPDANYGRAES